MSLFKKKYHYTLPERLTPDEARARRLTALLERETRFLDVPNFPEKLASSRSRVVRSERPAISLSVAKAIVDEPRPKVHKAALIAAALKTFSERDFADPEKRAVYRKLRAAQGGQQKVPPSGGNKSYFNPTGKDFASTIYGTTARLGQWTALGASAARMFLNPSQVIPCIQRSVRREVMFAKKHAGRGYRVKHRRSWSTGIPC